MPDPLRFTPRLLAATAGALLATAAAAQAPVRPPALTLDDAERFAKTFAAQGGAPEAARLQAEVLDLGSQGITLFTPHRIVNAGNLAQAVTRNRAIYQRAISLCLPVARQMQQETSALIQRIAELLGQTDSAPAYIVFGAGNSGGTADASGLVLGLEVICQQADSPASAAQIIRDFIAHEMTHVFQARAGAVESETDLLQQALIEGFADYLMERALDGRALAGAQRQQHGLTNEAALWREFKADVDAGRSRTEWLYKQTMSRPGRPPDMGYWIGKRICEAYVAQAANPREALQTLLALRNARQILAQSGYGKGFEAPQR